MAFYVSLGQKVLRFGTRALAQRYINKVPSAKYIEKPTNTQMARAVKGSEAKLVGGMLTPSGNRAQSLVNQAKVGGGRIGSVTATEAALNNAQQSKGNPLKVKVTEGYSPLKEVKPEKLKPVTPKKAETKTLPTPRKRPDSLPKAKKESSTLKNNINMSKEDMATSISAARKRGEGYYFDKKTGKKKLAVYATDMKKGESLRTTANRLLGLTKRK